MFRIVMQIAMLFFASLLSAHHFEPQEIQELSQKSVKTVDAYLALMSEKQLENLAKDFFGNRKTHVENGYSLAKAYRTELILEQVQADLAREYSGVREKSSWIWNNVGTVWARMKILYCSPREYVAVFGTQMPQSGYSGRYRFMDVWDVMLTGRMYSHENTPRASFPKLYLAGDVSFLSRKSTFQYQMEEFTYMIDYGRGVIPMSFYKGIIAPYLFSNQDSRSLGKQLRDCGVSMLKNVTK